MSSLLDQIAADAQNCLKLPPGCSPADAAAPIARFLRLEKHRLKLHHRRGASGREVCAGLARTWDLVFLSLLHRVAALEALTRSAGSPSAEDVASPGGHGRARRGPGGRDESSVPAAGAEAPVALVALGGYGRADLSPASGLEILILCDRSAVATAHRRILLEELASPALAEVMVPVQAEARTLDECGETAGAAFRALTALFDGRLVGGDAGLFTRLEAGVKARCVGTQEAAFLEAQAAEREARRAKYGQTVCLQEPHIQAGCGGLRDYHSLHWLAFFKHGCRTLAELEARGLINGSERVQLEAAYDFLLRAQNEAHFHTGRATDTLTKSIQPFVAHGLGYQERSLSRRIERFMRDYYRQARTLHLLARSIEARLASAPQTRDGTELSPALAPRQRTTCLIDGFRCTQDLVQAATPDVFREDPSRLMRVFRLAQQRGMALDPTLQQLVRQATATVGKEFRADPRVHQTFLEILNQRGCVAAVLRAMHEVGLLGAYLPAFGRLTCLVQHEFFHQYTADEHTLVCLEKLDEIAAAKEGLMAPYGEILTKGVERPYILYLALLLHDAGKARSTGDHADDGSRIAAAVARRLGLETPSTATLRLLVRHHLAMVNVSQRRDLDEPAEIRRFAALVGTVDHLNLLTLLTIADSLGTSDSLWNGFKDTLLLTLYWRTHELLTGGPEFIQIESRQRDRLAAEVRTWLPAGFAPDELAAHFDRMPPRYFRLREAKAMALDLEVIHGFLERALAEAGNPLEPVIRWQHDPDRGYSLVRIVTWDRAGLFSGICGSLTAPGLNILSAEIFTRDDSIVIDTFSVVAASRGTLAEPRKQERFAQCLHDTVCASADLRGVIHALRPSQPLYASAALDPLPTSIRFDNEAAETRTVLEIECQDRVGLLYAIAQVLSSLALDISVAKICTERGAASDSFYLAEASGSKIESSARQQEIAGRLRAAIAALR